MPIPAEPSPARGPRAVLPQAQVRAALEAEELRLHYQRVVDLASRRPAGVEALLRWDHPEGGLLPPDDFLPAIAHTSVMADVTRWVIRAALQDVVGWPGWTVSV